MAAPRPYTVTSITEELRLSTDGHAYPMVVIKYRIPARNYAGEIVVHRGQAEPDAVRALLEAEAARVEALYSL